MKRETIAIHVGYDGDPATKAVAVPIYQTVAFEFDSAEHGAALFNLEVQGNIYTRIGNPTNTVLEKRVAALEAGVEGLSVSSGMAAIEYSLSRHSRNQTGHGLLCLDGNDVADGTTCRSNRWNAFLLGPHPDIWDVA
jgi:O-acetylhomoserine (thiol)-lyase